MMFKDFIQTVKDAGKIPDNLDDIASKLCQYSNITWNSATAISYRKGRRTPRLDWEAIDEAGFIQYFREKTSGTWLNMQKTFADLDEYNVICQDIKEPDVFYQDLLSLFYKMLRVVPITLRNILPERPVLIGRETELQRIADIFEWSNHAILSGMGGLGKSQIALAYAHTLNKSNGWIIQHIICEDGDSLRKSVMRLQFDGLPESKKTDSKDNFKLIMRRLQRRQKCVVIVFDNFNHPFTQEDRAAYQELIGCGSHVHVLLTSRNALIENKQHIVHIQSLDNVSLRKLYEYYRFEDTSDHKNYLDKNQNSLEELFSLVENHTLAVILLAKLAGNNFLREDELCRLLKSNMAPTVENTHITKDGVEQETTLSGMLKRVFSISQFSEAEKNIMRDMSIMPLSGVKIDLFEKLTGHSRRDLLSLKRNHWIILDEEILSIRLHPLICETILSIAETKPPQEHCILFLKRVIARRELTQSGTSEWYKLSQIAACIQFEIIKGDSLFDRLKDEYRGYLFSSHRIMSKYSDSLYDDQLMSYESNRMNDT